MSKILFGDQPGDPTYGQLSFNSGLIATRAAATADSDHPVHIVQNDMKVKKVYASFLEAVTGKASTYATLSLMNRGSDGSGTTTVASLAFSTTSVVGGVLAPLEITLDTTVANLLVSRGEVLSWISEATAAGLNMPEHTITVAYELV